MEVKVTPELLSAVAGALLSLLASYFPKFAPWFQGLEPPKKRQVMALLLLGVTAIIVGLSCGGIIQGVQCSQNGIVSMVWAYILALVANQSTYSISKPSDPAPDQPAQPEELEA